RPDDPPGGIPQEEPPPAHAGDPCEPGGGDAQERDEPGEEDRLAAVPREEALARRERPLRVPPCELEALDQLSAADAPDPVAGVVPDDCAGSGDEDNPLDAPVVVGEHGGGDERGLSRKRDSRRLDA